MLRSIHRGVAALVLLSLASCARSGDERLGASSTSLADGLAAAPAVLTCEEAQSAGDPRSHWQLWLDPAPAGGYGLRRAYNLYDEWEGTLAFQVDTLAELDGCVAAAADPRFITCRQPGARFVVTSLVEETSIPFGGTDLHTTRHFDVTWQETGSSDRQRLTFVDLDEECWASADDRMEP